MSKHQVLPGLLHLKCSLQNAERGLIPQTRHKCVPDTATKHTHRHAHTRSPLLLTMGQDDRGLWVTLTHCRPPPLLHPWVQHRRLCTRSTISDHPSQTNLTAHRSPAPSYNSALCLNPKPEAKSPRTRPWPRQPGLPNRCLAPSPRTETLLSLSTSTYIMLDNFTHFFQQAIIFVLNINVIVNTKKWRKLKLDKWLDI